MNRFDNIYELAARQKGGADELQKLLPEVPAPEAVAALDESRFLAEMSRCVFQAGFRWSVIDRKWSGFEEVFYGFDPNTILGLPFEVWEDIGRDERIVRVQRNIRSVRANARFIEDVILEQGSFGQFIAGWPLADLVGLFALLKKRGSRLGGNTGQRFLRNIGKDTFILGGDVVRCLQNSGLEISDSPSSRRDMMLIQEAFNSWHEQTGLPYSHLSRIAAYSIG